MLVLARLTPAVGLIGNPDRQVMMPPICHPPDYRIQRTRFRISIFRPLPIGRSYSPEITSRWRLSNAERPRSQRMQWPSCENSVSLSEVRIPLVSSIDFDQVYDTSAVTPFEIALGQLRAQRVVVAAAAVFHQHQQPEIRIGRTAGDGAGSGNRRADAAIRLQVAADRSQVARFERQVVGEFALHVEQPLHRVRRAPVELVGERLRRQRCCATEPARPAAPLSQVSAGKSGLSSLRVRPAALRPTSKRGLPWSWL